MESRFVNSWCCGLLLSCSRKITTKEFQQRYFNVISGALSRSGLPWVKKIGYLCIQEIVVLTSSCSDKIVRTYILPPLHLSGVEMAQSLARNPRHILSVLNLVLDSHVMVNWQLLKKGIRWPVSHDCIAGSGRQLIEVTYFLKLSTEKFLVFRSIFER